VAASDSQFAIKLADTMARWLMVSDQPKGTIEQAVDAELQEVRDTFSWAFGENSGYWSYLMHEADCPWNTEPEDICTCRVERARALYQRLQPKE
jgi:hypothetical protein